MLWSMIEKEEKLFDKMLSHRQICINYTFVGSQISDTFGQHAGNESNFSAKIKLCTLNTEH